MAAALWTLVVMSVAVAALTTEWCVAATAAAEAANEVLRAHQLPTGITTFHHDTATGRFEAQLEAPCTARFEVGLRYNTTVTGVISPGQIAAISGVAAQDLLMWFPVHDIKVDIPSSGFIYFNVGVVKKHLPLAVFDAPPACTPDPLLRTVPQRLEDVGEDGLAMGATASSR
ncbi:hypothetical protein BDA96_02G334800 [Sorghum bicolor]|uniref:Uncharacterized protein n=1 Tax=Sorghum bicolor TaxID=4558 RepID=A0A921UVL0_SORBI|nr:hypothetical protein BDA96_02G334800 [Sorghum bicolor]